MKNKHKLNIAVTTAVAAAVTILNIALPRPAYSEIEKRELATIAPFTSENLLSGKFTKSVSAHVNDSPPFRDMFKAVGNTIRGASGIVREDMGESFGIAAPAVTVAAVVGTADEPVLSGDGAAATGVPADSANPADTAAATATPVAAGENGEPVAEDGVYDKGIAVVKQDGHWRGISMFGGGDGAHYAGVVSKIAAALPDVKVYNMIVPTSSALYTPSNYAKYNASQIDSINATNAALKGVIIVDGYTTLMQHKAEPIYTRTDHHWMPLGAYYATAEFAKAAGVPYKPLDFYVERHNPGYVGTMYSFTNSSKLLNDPEDFVYYYLGKEHYKAEYFTTSFLPDENAKYIDSIFQTQGQISYSVFMGGDKKIVRTTNKDARNGRRLCIVKDSYGNAEVPFLIESFDEVYVLDMRYIDLDFKKFIGDNGITDLLFTMCTYSSAGSNADKLDKLLG